MDELDILITKKQSIIYNLFEWPTRKGAQLIVIGISNTMNLPELLTNRIKSRMGHTRIIFKPYENKQLEKIVESRLSGLTIFDISAIRYSAWKVGLVSGDSRRVLELCR